MPYAGIEPYISSPQLGLLTLNITIEYPAMTYLITILLSYSKKIETIL